mmetsp:Transcript_19426/g.36123  ORF Transcript_19426/g.36123 Transcript_19426/m.36123 type:complete len:426 (-) Transcript_19426:91-1368(-)
MGQGDTILPRVPLTTTGVFLHLLKSNIGPGCLSLPHAFSMIPYSTSIPVFILIALITGFNSLKLDKLALLGESYSNLGLRVLGPRGGSVVNYSIAVQQLGVCTVYFSFVADNVTKLWGGGNERFVMTAMLPVCLMFVYVKSLKQIEKLSMVATFLLFLCLGGLVVMGIMEPTEDQPDFVKPDFTQEALAFSTILYSFEGACLVIPCRNGYGKHDDKPPFATVYVAAITVVSMTYLCFAVFCIYSFGPVDDGSITAFLVERDGSDVVIMLINCAIALTVVGSYGLQFWPVKEIVRADSITLAVRTEGYDAVKDVVERDDSYSGLEDDDDGSASSTSSGEIEGKAWKTEVALIVTTFMIAMVVPNVGLMISLAGSLAGTMSAVILPSLLDLEGGDGNKILNCVLIGTGVVFMIIGAGSSVAEIVSSF